MMTTKIPQNQIVLAHDSFIQYGGAERVFEAAQEIFPQSEIYTFVVDSKYKEILPNWKIITSPLQSLYNLYPHFQHLFALLPLTLKFWKPNAKNILSFSSSYIKGLKKSKNAIHINYCHTPTRFLWIDPEHAFKEIPKILKPLAKVYFQWLKQWDLRSAKNVDFFIANSKEVQKRIKKFYNRDSEIIYPFVDVNFWESNSESKQDYFLVAGRLQYAKGLDVVINTFNELGLPLHVAGTGRYEKELKKMAKDNIKFLGKITDAQLRSEYSNAKAFIYPQFEDFGIMPLEAASCGTATIGLARGGTLETVISGQTGILLEEINVESLKRAVSQWNENNYSKDSLRNQAQKFSKEIFQNQLLKFVESKIL